MKYLYYILLVIFVFSCNSKEKNNVSKTNLEVANTYDIEYPSHWVMDKSGKMGTTFILLRENEDPEQTFKENINLIEQDLDAQIKTLDDFVALTKNQIKGLQEAQILNSVDTTLNNKPAHLIEYYANLSGEPLHYIQYFMIKENKVLILTYTGEITHNYDNQEEVLNILNSFQY